jgi:hypothetical protein
LSWQRDQFAEPFIASWIAAAREVKLTPDEGREYASYMLLLAEAVER